MARIKIVSPTTGKSVVVTDDGRVIDEEESPVDVSNIKEAIKKLREEELKWQSKGK